MIVIDGGGEAKFLCINSSDFDNGSDGGGGGEGDSRSACHSSCLIVFVRLIGRFLGSTDDE